MRRPAGGFSKGSKGFEEGDLGLLDLGLLARAGENRSWNYRGLLVIGRRK